MVDRTLLKYVKEVYTLESERWVLERMIEQLNTECNNKKRQIQSENVNISWRPVEAKTSSCVGGVAKIVFAIFLGMGGIVTENPALMLIFGIIALYLIFDGVSIITDVTSTNTENEWRKREAERVAGIQLNSIKRKNANIKATCANLENNIKELEACLKLKEKALQSMYDYNIIHQNYRNLDGMSKIYNLLDTGICDTLTGNGGAYDKLIHYMIYDNTKITNTLLKKIAETNQMIYNAINRTNNLLENVSKEIQKQSDNNDQILRSIKTNTEISNFLAESANNNIKALNKNVDYIAFAEKQRRLGEGHFY